MDKDYQAQPVISTKTLTNIFQNDMLKIVKGKNNSWLLYATAHILDEDKCYGFTTLQDLMVFLNTEHTKFNSDTQLASPVPSAYNYLYSSNLNRTELLGPYEDMISDPLRSNLNDPNPST